jgi:predicted methyltransferase
MSDHFPVVISWVQIEPLLRARRDGQATAITSPDLSLSIIEARLTPAGIVYPDGARLAWSEAERIVGDHNKCFTVGRDGTASEIAVFSEQTQWRRSLMPTTGAPTMLVSGIPMHRIKDTDPRADTLAKVKAIAPIVGRVLDTATGLGYTAIEAARTAEEVVTLELDPAGLEVARRNPWSRDLFTCPNIRQMVGDAVELVPTFADGTFTRILHDPPMLSLAGELYSAEFYGQLRRVLRRGGRLFHYIGDPTSPSGKRTTAGVLRRLQAVGFTRVVRHPEAFGVVAFG